MEAQTLAGDTSTPLARTWDVAGYASCDPVFVDVSPSDLAKAWDVAGYASCDPVFVEVSPPER